MDDGQLPPPAYRAVPGLLFKSWDDDALAVVFDPGSAKTHLLSAAAAQLLQSASQTAVALADAVTDEHTAPPDWHDLPQTPWGRVTVADARQAIDSLERAGLLRPSPCPPPSPV